MNRKWHNALGWIVAGLVAATALTGCFARPAPRPGPTATPAIDPARNTAVAQTAAGIGGAGTVESVVMNNRALMAIQLNSAHPGGTEGGPLGGKSNDPDYPGTSPGGGPGNLQGPGGSVGTTTALPGGGTSPGAGSGTPEYTQAVPHPDGSLQTQSGTSSAASPGAVGNTPHDVMTRIANMVRSKHPEITEVRFATISGDARRLAEIAAALRNGQPAQQFMTELEQIRIRSTPAGVVQFSPDHPPQGKSTP